MCRQKYFLRDKPSFQFTLIIVGRFIIRATEGRRPLTFELRSFLGSDLQSSSSSEEESVTSSDDGEDDSGTDEVAAKRPRTPTTPHRRPKTVQHTPKRTTALKTIREEDDCVKVSEKIPENVESFPCFVIDFF